MASHQSVGSLGGTMGADERAVRVASRTHRVLGECWIVYGLIHLVVAAAMFVWSAIATVMFGALLDRVPDPFTLMAIFHVFYMGGWRSLRLWGECCGLFAGVALMQGAAVGAQSRDCCRGCVASRHSGGDGAGRLHAGGVASGQGGFGATCRALHGRRLHRVELPREESSA